MKEKSFTNSQYADEWEKESLFYYQNGIYQKVFSLLPHGKVLEVGCGCGFSTLELLKTHEVLSLECNQFLINKAADKLEDKKFCIHKCDFLKLSSHDKNKISAFKPDIIVGCFIGANGLEILKHIKDTSNVAEKAKKYREKIEYHIASREYYFKSVSTIQLVNRGSRPSHNYSIEEVKKSIKKEYDDYVFTNNGYSVIDVTFFDWPLGNSGLNYGTATGNINLEPKEYMITSIIASI